MKRREFLAGAAGLIASPALAGPAAPGRLLIPNAALGAGENLLSSSEDFNSWVKSSGATVTENTTIDPNGDLTADTITDPGGSLSNVNQTISSIADDTPYTGSVFILKDAVAKTTRFMRFDLQFITGGTSSRLAFNFATDTGEYGTNVENGFATIEGSGVISGLLYWRIWFAVRNDGSGNTQLKAYIYPAVGAHADLSTTNAATAGSVIGWGAQINHGTAVGPYSAS